MDVGVVSRSFPQLTNVEIADFMAKNGFKWVELCFASIDANYWRYNGRSDISDLIGDKAAKLISDYRSKDIKVTAIGVFTNLLEPDERELEENLLYFEKHMQIASQNKVPFVSTESGFIEGRRGILADSYEEDFNRLLDCLKWLTKKATEYDINIAFEPCVLDIVPSAKRMLDLINQVGSDRLNVLLDPANLIANSSEKDMFKYLAPHIGYFHGKDRKVNDAYGKVVGDGDIDWNLFLRLYKEYTNGKPFILEYVNIDNVCEIRDRVLEYSGGGK